MSRRQRHLGYRLGAGGFLFICALTLMASPAEVAHVAETPLSCILCGNTGAVDFFLNVLLFIPFGLGLALSGFSWRRVLVLSGLLTCGIELLQLKVIVGRDASLGDVIANTLGGGMGALAAASWRRVVVPNARRARLMALAYGALLCAIWSGTAWAFRPALPMDTRWFGAWAPELGNLELFPGKLLAVNAGGEPLLPGLALDQRRLHRAVAEDPSISFRAVLGARPGAFAPVGLVVDGRQRDVMLIGQERQDLAFTMRVRANTVKFWSPRVNLRNGMSGLSGDTVEARGALQDGAFVLTSQTHGIETSRRLPVSASWGWSLVTPWTSVLGEEVHELTALWIAGLVAVLAYWCVMAGGAVLAIIPATIATLLGVIPAVSALSPSHWSEWVAAIIGTALGALAASAARRRGSAGRPPGRGQDAEQGE